jgi:aryl-alcohol dehydrogenase (NADP+)
MKYTTLGNTGLEVSRLGLGMLGFGDPEWRSWILPKEEARPIVRRALEAGINFFDTADMYSRGVSEEITGELLGDMATREEVVVSTKVYHPLDDGPNRSGLGRKHVLDGVRDSLRRLEMDYIDLYQIHRWDYATPLEETLEALHDAVRAGYVRYVGASNLYTRQLARALYTADLHGWSRFVSIQNHYNLLYREEEREMLPLCREEGVAFIPWSPLARGYLARPAEARDTTDRGKSDDYARRQYDFPQADDIIRRVGEVATERGVSRARVALAWLLSKEGVTAPMLGTTKTAHLDDALGALDLELTEEETERLEGPYRPREVH